MAITPSMEKVMKVNVWSHAQIHVRRAALAVMAGGIVGCTAHPIPSAALDESPLASVSAMGMNSAGTQLPNARTDGNTLLFDDPNRVIRLANFDLSDPAPRDFARPGDLAAPIGTLTESVRLHQRRSEYAVLRLPWVRAPRPLTPRIQSSWESPDRTTDLLLAYYLDHAFDLTQADKQSMKAETVGTFTLAGDALYKMRLIPVESVAAMTVVAFE
jgi:hypothetical protein